MAWWTIIQTPCASCTSLKQNGFRSNGIVDNCNIPLYWGGYTNYVKPTVVDVNNQQLPWSCVWNTNGRLYGPGVPNIATLQNSCTVSGIGLETRAYPGMKFVPNFPGVYVLNYTVYDGCNPTQTVQVQVTAQCVTNMTQPTMTTNEYSVNFQCSNTTGTNPTGPGSFPTINLMTTFIATPSVSVASPPHWPGAFTQSCPLPSSSALTCSGAQQLVDSNPALQVYGVPAGQSSFKQCCKCLFGMSIVTASSQSVQTLQVVQPQQASHQALFAQESVQGVATDSSVSPASVVVPLAGLLVVSMVANIAVVTRRRRNLALPQ
jgi:hypothetical protein